MWCRQQAQGVQHSFQDMEDGSQVVVGNIDCLYSVEVEFVTVTCKPHICLI